jgi:TPR repeat protein
METGSYKMPLNKDIEATFVEYKVQPAEKQPERVAANRNHSSKMSPYQVKRARRRDQKAGDSQRPKHTLRSNRREPSNQLPALNGVGRYLPSRDLLQQSNMMPERFQTTDGYNQATEDGVEETQTRVSFWMAQPLGSVTAAAHAGDASAQAAVGISLLASKASRDEQRQALVWIRRAAKAKVTEAQYRLGVLHARGKIIPPDQAAALVWLERAANKHHERAMLSISRIHRDCDRPKVSGSKVGFKWLERAWTLGNQTAGLLLSASHAVGYGSSPDMAVATRIALELHQEGSIEGAILGAIINSTFLAGDKRIAMKLMEKTIESGDRRAAFILGLQKLEAGGTGPEAHALIKQAAVAGLPSAQFYLGLVLLQTEDEVILKAGKYWMQEASKQDHRKSQQIIQEYSLNEEFSMMIDGVLSAHAPQRYPPASLLPQPTEALRVYDIQPSSLLEVRAAAGDASSALSLARLYALRDLNKGRRAVLKWMQRSAHLGSAVAARHMAELEDKRTVVTGSSKTSAEWLEIAASGGDADAQCMLANMIAGSDEPDKPRALALYLAAAGQGHREAQYQAALALRSNSTSPPKECSTVAANGWMQKSANQRHPAACRIVGQTAAPQGQAKWFCTAILAGDADAPALLAEHILLDKGDSLLVADLINLGMKRKSCLAHQVYARLILESARSEKYPNAVLALRFAVRGESPATATHMLARCYWRGRGVDRNSSQALALLNKAARLGSNRAVFDLGRFHYEAFNYESALGNFCQAGDTGMLEAAYMAGYIQHRALVAGSSTAAAEQWFRIAAAGGHVEASNALETLAAQGTKDRCNNVPAKQCLGEELPPPLHVVSKAAQQFSLRKSAAAHRVIAHASTMQPSLRQSVAPVSLGLQTHTVSTGRILQEATINTSAPDAVDASLVLHATPRRKHSYRVSDKVAFFARFPGRECPGWLCPGFVSHVIDRLPDTNVPQLYGFQAIGDQAVLFVEETELLYLHQIGNLATVSALNSVLSPPKFQKGDKVWTRPRREVSWAIGWVSTSVPPSARRPNYTYTVQLDSGELLSNILYETGNICSYKKDQEPDRYVEHQVLWTKISPDHGETKEWLQVRVVRRAPESVYPNDFWQVQCENTVMTLPWHELMDFQGIVPTSSSGMHAVGSDVLLWTVGRGLQLTQTSASIIGAFLAAEIHHTERKLMYLVKTRKGHPTLRLLPPSLLAKQFSLPEQRQLLPDTVFQERPLGLSIAQSVEGTRPQIASGKPGCLDKQGLERGSQANLVVSRQDASSETEAPSQSTALVVDELETKHEKLSFLADRDAFTNVQAIVTRDSYDPSIPNAHLKRLLETAVSQGNPECSYKLAVYQQLHGSADEKKQVHHMLRVSAEGGNADSLALLGYMHEIGQGVSHVNQKRAVYMYRKALNIDPHCIRAAWRLGRAIALGDLGEKTSFSMSVILLRKASQSIDAAALLLAQQLIHGPDPSFDSDEIVASLEKLTSSAEAILLFAEHLFSLKSTHHHRAAEVMLKKLAGEGSKAAKRLLAWQSAEPPQFSVSQPVRVAYTKGARRYAFEGIVEQIDFSLRDRDLSEGTTGRYEYRVALDGGGCACCLPRESLKAIGPEEEKAVQWGHDEMHVVEAVGKQQKLGRSMGPTK